MNVAPPTNTLHAPDPLQGRAARDERPAQERALAWEAASRRPDPAPAASAFAAQARVGDAAVRFDARAIVAPVAEPAVMNAANRIALTEASARTPAAAIAADVRAAVAASAQRPAAGGATPVKVRSVPAMVAEPVILTERVGANPAARAPFSASQPPRTAASATSAATSAQPAARPAQTSAAQSLIARIVAFADEVRIVIRGAALSPDDQAALIRVAEDTLVGTPLAGRPVRVIAQQESR